MYIENIFLHSLNRLKQFTKGLTAKSFHLCSLCFLFVSSVHIWSGDEIRFLYSRRYAVPLLRSAHSMPTRRVSRVII